MFHSGRYAVMTEPILMTQLINNFRSMYQDVHRTEEIRLSLATNKLPIMLAKRSYRLNQICQSVID